MNSESFRGDFPRGPQNILTPDLAENNPDAYKERLIEILHKYTVYSGAMWDHLCVKGVCHPSRLIIEPQEFNGSSQDGIITLGAQPWTTEEIQALTHTEQNFLDDRQFMYRFSHEISHILFTDFRHPKTTTLYNSFIKIRGVSATRGFSWLGHHKGYKETGPLAQAKEDVTELINKYLIDPRFLEDFLKALASNEKYYGNFRKNMGLIKITHNAAANIYKIIEDCINTRFQT